MLRYKWLLMFGFFSFVISILCWAACVCMCEFFPKNVYEIFWAIFVFLWIVSTVLCIGGGIAMMCDDREKDKRITLK
jgi:hypothetical protein